MAGKGWPHYCSLPGQNELRALRSRMKVRVARSRIRVCCEIGGIKGAGQSGSVSWTHALHGWEVFLCKTENLKTFEKFCIRKGSNVFCFV